MRFLYIIIIAVLFSSCTKEPEKKTADAPRPARNYYAQDVETQVRLTLYDPTGNKTGETFGTYVDGDIVVATLSSVRGSHSAKATPMNARTAYNVYGYTAVDFDNDLVLLRIGKRADERSVLDTADIATTDTIFCVEGTYEGKIYKRTLTDNTAPEGTAAGQGLFTPAGRLKGVLGNNGRIINVSTLRKIMGRQKVGHSSVYDLRLQTGRTYISADKIKGFKVSTSMGNFSIRLFDDVPEYRDNFIRLVSDGYYDSLLVHRVLPQFLIQTGAADSKYAKADDMVGWQGPGYTLPMVENQKHIHRRGAVAASKLPQDRNSRNRSDGGQFYVVSGRVHSAEELDKIGKEYYKTFTAEQKEVYTTVGGAPHLDGDYVVFGEVTSGMEVVDRIANVPLKGDRPVDDVRVYSISIIRK